MPDRKDGIGPREGPGDEMLTAGSGCRLLGGHVADVLVAQFLVRVVVVAAKAGGDHGQAELAVLHRYIERFREDLHHLLAGHFAVAHDVGDDGRLFVAEVRFLECHTRGVVPVVGKTVPKVLRHVVGQGHFVVHQLQYRGRQFGVGGFGATAFALLEKGGYGGVLRFVFLVVLDRVLDQEKLPIVY